MQFEKVSPISLLYQAAMLTKHITEDNTIKKDVQNESEKSIIESEKDNNSSGDPDKTSSEEEEEEDSDREEVKEEVVYSTK